MIFSTLGRYFFTRYMVTVGWFMAGTMAVIFLIDLSENSGRLSNVQGFTYTLALWLTLERLPGFMQQTVPFTVLFSGMTAMIALNRKHELVVTRAAGISVWQFMTPFVVGALVTGVATVAILNPLSAYSTKLAFNLEASLGSGNPNGFGNVPWLRDFSRDHDLIIGAANIDPTGTELSDAVFLHFDREGNVILRQDAAKAKLENGYWALKEVREAEPGAPARLLETAQVRTSLRQEYLQERNTSPETIGFFEIPARLAAARSYGLSTHALETRFQSLLSLPFLLVAMTLIAGTVSLKFSRFSQSSLMIFGGVIAGFMLYVVSILVRVFGSSGVVPPFVAAWIPVVVALCVGATILLHQEDG